jgi:hypothetical protein
MREAQAQLGSRPAACALFARATTAFMRELIGIGPRLDRDGQDLDLLARDDKALLAELLIQALQSDPLTAKETRLRLKGQLAFRQLMDGSGGAYSATELAQILRITPDAVRKRTARGKLLAVPQGARSVYPACQIDLTEGRVVEGLESVLPLLDTESAPAKLRFLLGADPDLGGTPLDALRRGDRESRQLVERKARQLGQQLAR